MNECTCKHAPAVLQTQPELPLAEVTKPWPLLPNHRVLLPLPLPLLLIKINARRDLAHPCSLSRVIMCMCVLASLDASLHASLFISNCEPVLA